MTDSVTCVQCGREDPDMRYIWVADEEDLMCEECYNRLFDECVWCNKIVRVNDLVYIDGEPCCQECRKSRVRAY